MKPKVADVARLIEELAPPSWAETWDNVGLLVGHPEAEAVRVLVALEATDDVVEEAVTGRFSLLLLHHPIIFRGVKTLRSDRSANRRLERLVAAGIAVYAAHTNFDQADGGTNDTLAAAVGIQAPEVLQVLGEERLLKLVVFVPRGHEDAVRSALGGAGAGHIGNYSHCTFQAPGTGTFLAHAGTNPFLGKVGELEQAEEYRLETVLPERLLRPTVAAMLAAHPYEEVAYDIYHLANPGRRRGHGRVGKLAAPCTLGALAERVKQALSVPHVRLIGDPASAVATAAVGAGAGSSLIGTAAGAGADVLVTGDIGHHDAQDALDAGLCVIDAGHWANEVIAMPGVAEYLRTVLQREGLAAEVAVAARQAAPWQVV